jgi:DNA-binding XRE family transcriptional regulator
MGGKSNGPKYWGFIKSRRIELGLSQVQVAEGICAREIISLPESNKTLPSIKTALPRKLYGNAVNLVLCRA